MCGCPPVPAPGAVRWPTTTSCATRTRRCWSGEPLDLQQLPAGVVDLKRGVADLVLLPQQPLQPLPGGVAVAVPVYQHVRGQRRLRRGDPPDVQVVYLGHALDARQPGTDPGRVDA